MTLDEYQIKARSTAIYPSGVGLDYCMFGLVGEAGELANKRKKILRGDTTIQHSIRDLTSELGDVLWYVANLAQELGYTLEEIAALNLAKLAKRQEENKLKGSGDNR